MSDGDVVLSEIDSSEVDVLVVVDGGDMISCRRLTMVRIAVTGDGRRRHRRWALSG